MRAGNSPYGLINMRRIWEYIKELGWLFLSGLLGLSGGVTCLVTGFVLTRNAEEQSLYREYGRYSDRVGLILIFGLALLFAGTVAALLSRRSR